ncbi:uncharacterized protein LOC127703947 [Mytilus californianus]|uniref:uncharacterized protein LOC127703947 n=1 Tax=Mytilus californianus TaxID=6549 RepID=UPI002246F9A1|nr:uncharacterized protein LOC127703947 [Mytilus californianus]
MTDQDVAMTDKLKEMLPEINGDDLYNSIQKAKTDISELTTLELLEKDLKIVSGTSIKVAMSSVSISLQDFLSRENLIEDLSSFVQSQSVLAVIVMMIHQVTEGQPVRDIAVYSTEIILQQKICDQLSANRDPVLELSPVRTDKQNLTCYKQGCVRASRKVVLPLIQSIVNEYKDVTSHSDEHSNSAEKSLDSIDLFNLSGDQTSQNQFVASVPLDNFDLLNLAGQQSSQNQSETGTNQNLMDEFDIFAGTDTANNAQINNTDVFNDLPLDSQNQLDLNFDLVGTSEQTSQLESSSNVDLLGGFDPFSSSSNNTPIIVNNLPSNIPEINIDSEQATDEFNEADIMFGSQTLETPHSGMNSVSQGSSAHNSEPGSAFASYPITPPNSFIDATGHAHAKEFVLPSLNSAEMLEKIRKKKGRLRSTESTSADGTDNDPNSVPYTPQNSYMEGAFDQYAKDHQLPSFNSMEMVQRIKQKRSSMEMSRLDEEDDIVRLRSESGEVTPFTPHNSFRDLSLLEKNSKTFLDTNRLHQTLRNIEDDASEANQDVDEDSLAVNEITDSGLLMFDTSDMLNPTDVHNNVVAVGIAQEMVKRETTSEDLLVSFFDAPSDGGSRLTDSSSSSFDTKSSQDRGENSNNDNNFQNFQSKGSNSDDLKTEELVLDQSIDEFAQNLTENLIEDAINSFPENELPTETEKEELSATSPVSTEENYFKENNILEILESPSSTGSVITPEEVPVETDYLSSVDIMHGNLDLVKAAEEKEIVESISFRKISGEEPQTVRQEILLRNTPDKVDEDTEPKMEDSNGAVDEYAAELIQQVISGAIATVTTATNTVNRDIVSDSSSDITEESGVTWSRETSFDTVSSIPSKDGQTVIWSNQGSLDTPRSSIDTGATSLESDEMLLLAQSAKNGQMSSFETPESNDYLSSTSSSKRSSDPKVESSEKIKEHSVSDLNIDVSNEKELVQSLFNDQSDSLLEFAAGSDLDKHDGNQINNQTLLDFAGSDLIQTDLLPESLKSDNAINELSNISDKPAIGMVNIDKMESVDFISSENYTENLSPLRSDDALNELSNISDKPAFGMGTIDKMESVELSSENETENLSSLKTNDAFDELSNISDKPAVGMVNISEMESVDYISSENEAEILSPLKSGDAFNEQRNISDEPAIGEGNIDKMESVDYISSENEAENLSLLKSADAEIELSKISDKPAVGMVNIDKMDSVDNISSEIEAENLSPLKSEDALNELSNISNEPAIGMGNIDKMESVDYISSENKTENLRSDNAFNELNDISDKPAIGMENIDKMESVDFTSSEKEAENLSPLKTDDAFNELSNISDKPAIGEGYIDKMESVELSSENEAESLSTLKPDNVGLLEQSQDSMPYNIRKKESLDYISSEGETDNLVKLQHESEDLKQNARSTYHKAETLDYISSEGEGNDTEFVTTLQGMYSSQSSEPTSTTTEGSYQVLSPDQQIQDIKGEITDMINSEIEGEVTHIISDIKMEFSGLNPDVCETKENENNEFVNEEKEIDENETDLNKHDEEFISNENLLGGVAELGDLKGDNLKFSNNSSNELVGEGNEIDENETDLKKNDEKLINNENVLGAATEGHNKIHDELKGDNFECSNNSTNELAGEGNEIDEKDTNLNKQDEEFITNENLEGAEAEGYDEIHDESKGNNLEFSNISTNELAGEGNEIDGNETDLKKQDEEVISNENLLGLVAEGYNEIHGELKGDNLEFTNNSSNELVGGGNENDENETNLKKIDEVISNENLLGSVAEGELKGDNLNFSNISSNELVVGGNEIDFNKHHEEVISNENLLGGVTEYGELKGDHLEFSNNSSNELVEEGNEIDETDLNKQDEEFVSNENLQGAEAEGELKGDNLEFSNISTNELAGEGNEIDENETDLKKQDEEVISNENLLGLVAEGYNEVHGELKGDNLEFSNNSSNELVEEENEINENEIDFNKHHEEVISNENLLGGVTEYGEPKGDHLEFSNNSSNELVEEGNEIDETDLNKQDEEFVSNENFQGAVAEGELKGDNLEFSNISTNELVGEGNEIDENETDLKKQDEEVISKENLLGSVAEGYYEEKDELKGDSLEFTNNSSNELAGKGNENEGNEIDLNKRDEEVINKENLQDAVAEVNKEIHGESKGDDLEFTNTSSNKLVEEGNEIDETDLEKQDDEFVSNENLQGAVAEGELKGDNLEFSNNLSNDTHTKISETCVIDESGIDTNENSAIDSIKRTKEIYMTSAGRISIASDGDSENAKQRFSVTDNFIEETHNEVGKLIADADETLAQADETVFEADTILACIDINPLEENITNPTNMNVLSSTNGDFSCMDVFVEEDLKEKSVETVDDQLNCENEPETVSKEPENISVDTENKTQEPVNKSEELVNQTQEPVSKSEELVNQTQEPVSKSEELVSKTQEPVSKSEELVSKTQEPVSKSEELVNETQEPVSKSEEPENKTKELVSNSEEPENKTTESVKSVKFQQEKTNEGTEKPKVAKPVKKGMDMTEEWHEDPIPGMGDADNDTDSSDSRSRHSSGDSDSSDSTRPANRPTSLQTRKKKKISANFNILKEDYASPDDIDTTDNPGDLEWENDTPVSIPKDPIPEYSAEDEYQDAKHWRGVEINGKQQKIDLKVIDPYKKVLTHGGYYGDGLNAIIVFSGCYLPDRSRKDYNYVMDNLFLYVISTLELLVAEDYMIVYFHGATPRRQMPSFGWLKKCYQMIDRRLKKNLKGLLLIHPTLWLRTIVLMTKPFISSKFSSKLKFVRTLHDLSNIVPVEYIYIPDQVKKYDSLLQHRSPAHSSSSSAPHSPP